MLFVAMILLLIGVVLNFIIPSILLIGGILNIILSVVAYIMVFIGWGKIKNAAVEVA